MNDKYKALAHTLVVMKDLCNMFTIQEVAQECDVSEMTVRNFESGKTINFHVFCFYLSNVLYNLKFRTDEMVKNYNTYVEGNYGSDTVTYYRTNHAELIAKYREIISTLESIGD